MGEGRRKREKRREEWGEREMNGSKMRNKQNCPGGHSLVFTKRQRERKWVQSEKQAK